MGRETSVTLRVKDSFSRQFHDFNAGLNKSTGAAKSFGTRAGEAFGTVVKWAPVAGAALAGFVIHAGMQMEQTRIAFKTLTGSTEEAQKHLEELRDFAAKTPFQFTDLTQASRRLMAFGFEAEKVIPMLRDIGDAVAAMGGSSDMIDRVTLAIGQMSAKGKVSAQEMLQLTEAGIPAWRFLAESVGVSTAEVQKMTEKGLIPANQAIDAILGGMRKDFGGMMAEQSKTAAGQLSNVVDLLVETATTLGEALLPAIKSVIEGGLLPFVQGLKTLIVGGEEANKELIKLSNSPYILERGFGKLAILLRAGGELTGVYNNHLADMSERLEQGIETQDSFTKEMKRSRDEVVKGLLQMQLYAEANAFLEARTDDLIEAEAEQIVTLQRAREASQDYAHGMTEADFAAQRLAESTAETVDPLNKMRDALRDVDVRMGMLKDIMAGAVGNELRDFKEAQEENRAKAAELREELDRVPEGTARWSEIKGQLDTLDQEFAENAAEHEKATGRILFDIAAQQLAMDGLTLIEVEALRSLAVEWGLMDEATANATRNVLGAVVQLSEDQSLPNFRKNMEDARNEAMNLGNTINGIPREIDITFRLHTEGTIPDLPAPGDRPIPMQHGGRTRRGETLLVGEREPEIFVPEQSGFIVNQQQAAQAAAGMPLIGSIVVNNPAPGMDVPGLVREIEVALATRARAMRQAGAAILGA